MFCSACGKELGDNARFCSVCGRSTGLPPREKRLVRVMSQKKIAGVCAGFARYFDLDVTLIRIAWLLVVLGAGVGVLAYLIAWIVMPRDTDVQPEVVRQPESAAS